MKLSSSISGYQIPSLYKIEMLMLMMILNRQEWNCVGDENHLMEENTIILHFTMNYLSMYCFPFNSLSKHEIWFINMFWMKKCVANLKAFAMSVSKKKKENIYGEICNISICWHVSCFCGSYEAFSVLMKRYCFWGHS